MNWITNSVLPKIKAWVQSDDVPDNLWIKCPSCSQMIFNKDYEQQFNCCPGCNHHHVFARINALSSPYATPPITAAPAPKATFFGRPLCNIANRRKMGCKAQAA